MLVSAFTCSTHNDQLSHLTYTAPKTWLINSDKHLPYLLQNVLTQIFVFVLNFHKVYFSANWWMSDKYCRPGPSCSKLMMSLVNDSLKFTSSDTQICCNFLLKKNVSSFCSAKATHIFSAKNIRTLYIESAKTVNEMTLNELVKLTRL